MKRSSNDKMRKTRAKGRNSRTARIFFYSAAAATAFLTIAAPALYLMGYKGMSFNDAEIISTVALSFFLSTFAVSWMLRKGAKPGMIIAGLGLSRDKLTARNLGYGVLIFAAYILLIIAIGVVSKLTGIQVSSNASSVLGAFPLWLLPFVMFLAPLNEEIMFRGFLVPRIGIIVSALIFALVHGGYASYVELFMALWFGLVAGYVFKRTGSLYPSLVTHILVDTTTTLALLGTGAIALVHLL